MPPALGESPRTPCLLGREPAETRRHRSTAAYRTSHLVSLSLSAPDCRSNHARPPAPVPSSFRRRRAPWTKIRVRLSGCWLGVGLRGGRADGFLAAGWGVGGITGWVGNLLSRYHSYAIARRSPRVTAGYSMGLILGARGPFFITFIRLPTRRPMGMHFTLWTSWEVSSTAISIAVFDARSWVLGDRPQVHMMKPFIESSTEAYPSWSCS